MKETPSVRSRFFRCEAFFRGGVRVAVGDLNNDGFAEIVTASEESPSVRNRFQ